ncbi:MAG: beta strand repeat-containing protein [Elsteraceae bacterium]
MAGDGGKAVVWADDSTRFNGSISARGGLLAGNGGRVETSGKRALDVSPLARVTSDGRAAGAKTGAWLLDPVDITISTTGAVMPGGSLYSPLVTSTITAASISSALINNDVTIQTSGGSGGNGDIVFESGSIVYSGATQRTLSLKADRDINIKSGTAIDLSGAAHNIILNAGATAADSASLVGGIMVEDATIKTTGGYIWMVGGPSQSWAARASTDLNTFGAGVYLNDNVVIDAGAGSFKAIGAGRDVAGSNQYSHGFEMNNTVSITANGGLSITGTGGSAAGDEWRGVNLISSTINVSTGDVTITGTGGATSGPGGSGGASGSGVVIQAMTMNLGSGTVSITGTAGSGGTSEQNVGVLIRNSSALTGSGAMTITGVGGGATGSSKNYGVSVQGSSITLSGTGTVTLDGTRGVGENSFNVDIASGSSVSSANGGINLIGTATSGGAVTANKASGVVIKGNVETADGVIKIDGKGGLLGGSNNDGVIPDGTIKATNAGSIEITGEASAGFGFAAEFALAERVVTNTGDITIRTNSIYWYGSSEPGTVKSTSGSVKVQPLTDASSIGVGGAVGGLNLSTDFLNTVDGKIEIGRSDLSAAITIADGYIAPKDFKFVSDSGAINFLGAVGSNSGLRSLTIQNASGTTSFGGAVGGGASPFTTINVSGALLVSGDVTSSGAQSYGGAVALASSATFTTTGGANVTFAGPVDAETAGSQFLSTSLGGGPLSLIGGVGQSKALASLNISDPVALAGAIKTTGTQSYGGAVSILNDTTLSFSNLRFNAGVTGSANLTLAAGFIELSGGSIDIGSGTLSFAGGAYITSDLTIDAAATIFNTDTLNLSTPYSLTIASGDLTMSTGTGAGSLTSLTVSAGATKLGYKVTTSGSQSYGGTVTLSDDLDLTSTDVGGSISFGGAIDGAGKTLVLSTNGSAITLPTVTVKELSVTTIGGAVTQAVSVTATVTTKASIDAGSGLISLSNSGNSIAELSLTTTNAASVNLSGTTELSNSDVASLSLTTTGSVTQSGPLKASYLSLSGAGGSYDLTNSANEIHGLVANTGTVKIINSGASDLEIVSAGVTVTGDLTLTQLGSSQKLKVNGPIDLGSGAGSFTVDGTIEGSGTISGSGATLALSAGLTGSTVATTGGVTVSVVSGEFNVNGTLKTSTPPSVLPSPPSAPTTVSTPSQQSVASVPSVPSTPTQSSQASQISQASSPSVASAPTASETPSVDKALEADTTPILIGNEPVDEVVGRLIVAIDPISSNLGNSLSPSVQEEEGRVSVQPQTQSAGGASGSSGSDTQTAAVTAQRQLSLVNATAVGALIPPSPPVVASTGAPLASASTIKLDPADTGGANGQVIARGGADSAVGVNVSGAASQAGGSTTLLPGLLVQAPRNAPPRAEPPLAEQPSAINEEVFLD